MRIGYIINGYPKVSHTFIRREILELERQGVHVERYALRGWDAPAPDPVDAEERARTRYVLRERKWQLLRNVAGHAAQRSTRLGLAAGTVLRLMRKSDRPAPIHIAYLAEACTIARWALRDRIDHLHAHFGTNAAEIGMLASMISGIPYSFTMHGSEEWDRPEYLALDAKIAGAAFVAAVSSYTRSQLYRWSASADWHKIKIVRCGLDDEFLAAVDEDRSIGNRLVFVGRLYEGKGTTIVLEAAAQLAARGLEFEIVFAGDGEGRPQVEALARRLGIAERISVTGWVGSREVHELIRSSRCLVLPSFAEGVPVVIMEALACERPVIATYVGGIPELVLPGECGWLVPAADVDGLAAAMAHCLQLPAEAVLRLGRNGRERVAKLHDIRSEAARLAELFRRSCAARLAGEQEAASEPAARVEESGGLAWPEGSGSSVARNQRRSEVKQVMSGIEA